MGAPLSSLGRDQKRQDGKGVTFEAVFGSNDLRAIPAFKLLERIAGRGLETGRARLQ